MLVKSYSSIATEKCSDWVNRLEDAEPVSWPKVIGARVLVEGASAVLSVAALVEGVATGFFTLLGTLLIAVLDGARTPKRDWKTNSCPWIQSCFFTCIWNLRNFLLNPVGCELAPNERKARQSFFGPAKSPADDYRDL